MVVGVEELGENMGSYAACCAAEEDGFERHLGSLGSILSGDCNSTSMAFLCDSVVL